MSRLPSPLVPPRVGPGREGEPPRPLASLQEEEPRAGGRLPRLPVLVSSAAGHNAEKHIQWQCLSKILDKS